jgi:uncharacterized membrane protein YeiH
VSILRTIATSADAGGHTSTLLLVLGLAGTFAFGLSGGLAGVHAGLDLFGIVVLAFVVALAGGIFRDLLIGVAPQTFRDWRYLVAAGAAGVVCIAVPPQVQSAQPGMHLADALGLSLFCVTGATAALSDGVGAVQATIVGAITAIGGGMSRDVLLREVPAVLRQDLYAIPALLGASIVAIAASAGSHGGADALLGAGACFSVRMLALRYGLSLPKFTGGRPTNDRR